VRVDAPAMRRKRTSDIEDPGLLARTACGECVVKQFVGYSLTFRALQEEGWGSIDSNNRQGLVALPRLGYKLTAQMPQKQCRRIE
jgi:hypothetical protein